MWLLLICRKLKPVAAVSVTALASPKRPRATGMSPLMVQSTPVPAHTSIRNVRYLEETRAAPDLFPPVFAAYNCRQMRGNCLTAN